MRPTPPTPVVAPAVAVLGHFVDAGLFDAASVQVATAVARLIPDISDEVILATALAVRGPSYGHVCLDLDRVAGLLTAEGDDSGPDHGGQSATPPSDSRPWPELSSWPTALAESAAVAVRDPRSGEAIDGETLELRPLVFDGRRVYLERYWRYERSVGDFLLDRASSTVVESSPQLEAILDEHFTPDTGPDRQRQAARLALTSNLTVIAGGPGTGKTHTVARLLAAAQQLSMTADRPLHVALAAPTGKAAARMTEAVHAAVAEADLPATLSEPLLATEATTLHRLLGRGDGVRSAHDAARPLPHDIVVVDETSMVSLPLMARLFDAIRPDARLVLVGDPFQLASVEAGAVLGDIVGPAAQPGPTPTGPLVSHIVVLDRVHRFAADSAIAGLADAVRRGDADAAIALLRAGGDELTWIDPADTTGLEVVRREVVTMAAEVIRYAMAGNAEAGISRGSELKVLTGTRHGPLGSHAWRDLIERRVAHVVAGFDIRGDWYIGRPVMVTHNDYPNGLFNGDTGLVVTHDGRPAVAFVEAGDLRLLSPSRLAQIDTWWAMTVHKSQGSEFEHAVVALPSPRSRVLTRELLYTAITRARSRMTLIAGEASIRAAIARPVERASGLADRCWP